MKEKTRSVLTACDSKLEDLLPWWIQNTQKFTNAPIYVVDLGLNEPMVNIAQGLGAHVGVMEPIENVRTWFNKPWCLQKTQTQQTLWLDVDCEVLKSIDDIWMLCENERILIAPDPVMRRQGPEHSGTVNTGVMLYENLDDVFFKRWQKEIKGGDHRGDQEALRELISRDSVPELLELPQEWNWLRLMYTRGEDNPDKRILHWTGRGGKGMLRDKVIPRFFTQQKKKGNTTMGHHWSPEGYDRKTED